MVAVELDAEEIFYHLKVHDTIQELTVPQIIKNKSPNPTKDRPASLCHAFVHQQQCNSRFT